MNRPANEFPDGGNSLSNPGNRPESRKLVDAMRRRFPAGIEGCSFAIPPGRPESPVNEMSFPGLLPPHHLSHHQPPLDNFFWGVAPIQKHKNTNWGEAPITTFCEAEAPHWASAACPALLRSSRVPPRAERAGVTVGPPEGAAHHPINRGRGTGHPVPVDVIIRSSIRPTNGRHNSAP